MDKGPCKYDASLKGATPVMTRSEAVTICHQMESHKNDAILRNAQLSCNTSSSEWDKVIDRSMCDTDRHDRNTESGTGVCCDIECSKMWKDHQIHAYSSSCVSKRRNFCSILLKCVPFPMSSSIFLTHGALWRFRSKFHHMSNIWDIPFHLFPSNRKSNSRTIGIQSIFLFLLLVFSSMTLSSGQQTDNSRISRHSWTLSGTFDIQELDRPVQESIARFEFPELMAFSGKLFQYQIPAEAFPKLKDIYHYQVSEVGQDIAPGWLYLDPYKKGLLNGMPLESDIGQTYISIEAVGYNQENEQVTFSEVVPITITNNTNLLPSISNCSTGNILSSNLVIMQSLAAMSPQERATLMLTLAELTGKPLHQMMLKELSTASPELWSHLVRWYDPQTLRRTSILTITSACSVKSINIDKTTMELQEILEQLFFHCQNGLPITGHDAISCGAWFITQGSLVLAHSGDPLPQIKMPEHARVRRQAELIIEDVYTATDDPLPSSQNASPSSAVRKEPASLLPAGVQDGSLPESITRGNDISSNVNQGEASKISADLETLIPGNEPDADSVMLTTSSGAHPNSFHLSPTLSPLPVQLTRPLFYSEPSLVDRKTPSLAPTPSIAPTTVAATEETDDMVVEDLATEVYEVDSSSLIEIVFTPSPSPTSVSSSSGFFIPSDFDIFSSTSAFFSISSVHGSLQSPFLSESAPFSDLRSSELDVLFTSDVEFSSFPSEIVVESSFEVERSETFFFTETLTSDIDIFTTSFTDMFPSSDFDELSPSETESSADTIGRTEDASFLFSLFPSSTLSPLESEVEDSFTIFMPEDTSFSLPSLSSSDLSTLVDQVEPSDTISILDDTSLIILMDSSLTMPMSDSDVLLAPSSIDDISTTDFFFSPSSVIFSLDTEIFNESSTVIMTDFEESSLVAFPEESSEFSLLPTSEDTLLTDIVSEIIEPTFTTESVDLTVQVETSEPSFQETSDLFFEPSTVIFFPTATEDVIDISSIIETTTTIILNTTTMADLSSIMETNVMDFMSTIIDMDMMSTSIEDFLDISSSIEEEMVDASSTMDDMIPFEPTTTLDLTAPTPILTTPTESLFSPSAFSSAFSSSNPILVPLPTTELSLSLTVVMPTTTLDSVSSDIDLTVFQSISLSSAILQTQTTTIDGSMTVQLETSLTESPFSSDIMVDFSTPMLIFPSETLDLDSMDVTEFLDVSTMPPESTNFALTETSADSDISPTSVFVEPTFTDGSSSLLALQSSLPDADASSSVMDDMITSLFPVLTGSVDFQSTSSLDSSQMFSDFGSGLEPTFTSEIPLDFTSIFDSIEPTSTIDLFDTMLTSFTESSSILLLTSIVITESSEIEIPLDFTSIFDSIEPTSTIDSFDTTLTSFTESSSILLLTSIVITESSEIESFMSIEPTVTSDILIPFESDTIIASETDMLIFPDSTDIDDVLTTIPIQIVPSSLVVTDSRVSIPPSLSPSPSPMLFFCDNIDCNNGTCREEFDDCDCFLGWEGDFCDSDINYCDPSPCDLIGSVGCMDGNSTFTCECRLGFTGQNCSSDINVCDNSLCQNNATCMDFPGSGFSCMCLPGFTGPFCEVDLCDPNPCLFGGTCAISDAGDQLCVCPPDRNGTNCQFLIDPCDSQPCFNNGTCSRISSTNFTCSCPSSTQGDHCEVQIVACDTIDAVPCFNNATCRIDDLQSTIECICPPGYTGTTCEILLDPCRSSPCANGGTCFLSMLNINFSCSCPEALSASQCEQFCKNGNPEGFFCLCLAGFSGERCEVPGNPCDNTPCQNDGTCTMLSPLEFACTCSLNFTGSLCDIPVSPCDSTPCQNNGTCQAMSLENFECLCLEGYTGSLCEDQIDPCDVLPCENNGTCEATSFDSFICTCPEEYTGLLCDIPIDPCQDAPCLNNGTCEVISFNDYACMCLDGYTGLLCEDFVDPCSSMPCQNNATCQMLSFDSFNCMCLEQNMGLLCEVEIDPCNSLPCENNGTCESTSSEEFTCTCSEEYTGLLCEVQLDPCDSTPCENNGTCIVTSFEEFICTCSEVYTGLLCEVQLDPCDSSPCDNNGTCNTLSSSTFSCSCTADYTGEICEVFIDPCGDSPCGNNGTCERVTSEVFICSCPPELTGELCEVIIDPCALMPCTNNGTCERINSDTFTCACLDGYTGEHCEVEVDLCESSPCLNNGTCEMISSIDFFCVCSQEYTGMTCDIPVNPCDDEPCMNNATCIALSFNAFNCSCLDGYTGGLCETMTDPCTSNPCENNGTCEMITSDFFTCFCTDDYTGSSCETFVDPCGDIPCLNNGTCTRVSSDNFTCSCSPDFTGTLCEDFLDPCIDLPCVNNGTCVRSSPSSFTCLCPLDYTGSICEEFLDPCSDSPCLNNGTCLRQSPNNFTCLCPLDYTGIFCGDYLDPCLSVPCSNNGTCSRLSPDSFTCACSPDYTGLLCEVFINPCTSSSCFNNGTCNRQSSENFTCSCPPDYSGNMCEEFLDPCKFSPCLNNGTCNRLSSENFTCSCSVDYTGSRCDVFIDPCESSPCFNNATCNRISNSNFICACSLDYTGALCEDFIDPCGDSPCLNNGTCSRVSPDNFTCLCSEDYTGNICDVFIDPCDSQPCVNNGTCSRLTHLEFSCSCLPGYTGNNCSIELDPCSSEPCLNNATCNKLSPTDFLCMCIERYSGDLCEFPPPNRPPTLQNSIPTQFATEGQLFESTLPDPVFYDPDEGHSDTLTYYLLDSATNALPNTTWIRITANGSRLEGLPTSDQLVAGGMITEYTYIYRATDLDGGSADEFVVIQIFPQFPPVSNLFTIFIDRDFTMFSQTLSDKIHLFTLLDSYGEVVGGVPSTGTIHLSHFSNGSVAVVHSNISIPSSNCEDFMSWVATVYSFDDSDYNLNFKDALQPFVPFKTPFIEGPCNLTGTNPVLPATLPIRSESSPILLLSIVVPSAILALLFLIIGLSCFILYRRKRTERRDLDRRYERRVFLNRRPAILEGELAMPERRRYPARLLVDGEGRNSVRRQSGRRRREEDDQRLLVEAIRQDNQFEEDESEDENLPDAFWGEDQFDGVDNLTPPPDYSPPPVYHYVRVGHN